MPGIESNGEGGDSQRRSVGVLNRVGLRRTPWKSGPGSSRWRHEGPVANGREASMAPFFGSEFSFVKRWTDDLFLFLYLFGEARNLQSNILEEFLCSTLNICIYTSSNLHFFMLCKPNNIYTIEDVKLI